MGKGARIVSHHQRIVLNRLWQRAHELLYWHRNFHTVRSGSFENGDIVWFPEGGLNASYNCVDRWAYKHPEKVSVVSLPSLQRLTVSILRLPSSTKLMSLARVAKSATANSSAKSAASPTSSGPGA